MQSGGRLNVARAMQALLGQPTTPQAYQPACEALSTRFAAKRCWPLTVGRVCACPAVPAAARACTHRQPTRAHARAPPRLGADAMVATPDTTWSLSWYDAIWDLYNASSALACQDLCLSRSWCLRSVHRASL